MKSNPLRRPFAYRQYNVVIILIAINIGVYLLTNIVGRSLTYLSMNPVLVIRGHYWWQILTYMFVHSPLPNLSHILLNMLALVFFGVQVERAMGSTEFLVFYLVTGVLAGLFSLVVFWVTGSYMTLLMGASGAVYGVLLAFATYYPDARIYVFGILPVRAPILVLGYAAIAFFSQIMGRTNGVAHVTHLAGLVFGYLYLLVRLGLNPMERFFPRR